jgi:hypothetical protein
MIGLCGHITRKYLSWEMRRGVEGTCRAAQIIAGVIVFLYSAVSANGLPYLLSPRSKAML